MLVLDATVGGASANSYNTEDDLGGYADAAFPEPGAWLDAASGSDQRLRPAVAAARELDRLRFPGVRATPDQVREWPRREVRKPEWFREHYPCDLWPCDVIPEPVKHAHALLTFFLADCHAQHRHPFAPARDAGLVSVQLGFQVAAAFEPGASGITEGARFMAATIRPLLAQVGLVYAPQPRMVRG